MALSNESNTNLAFDTERLRKCGREYKSVSDELTRLSDELNQQLEDLKNSGWTTPAGSAFHEMVNTNWRVNIDKYTALLDTLSEILDSSCNAYEDLVNYHIEQVKL